MGCWRWLQERSETGAKTPWLFCLTAAARMHKPPVTHADRKTTLSPCLSSQGGLKGSPAAVGVAKKTFTRVPGVQPVTWSTQDSVGPGLGLLGTATAGGGGLESAALVGQVTAVTGGFATHGGDPVSWPRQSLPGKPRNTAMTSILSLPA